MTPTSFIGGDTGPWRVLGATAVTGAPLAPVARVDVVEDARIAAARAATSGWRLRGVASNHRYTTRAEKTALAERQAGLGRPEATYAALIPMRKTAAWWDLAQDERRAIFEERSHHIAEGLRTLPAVARKLYHSRDLAEPFDFITWFELAPKDVGAFDDLVRALRATEEWRYVDREVDIRLTR